MVRPDGRPYECVGANKRTVWSIATQPYKGAHFATFPEKLVEPCILAGTSEHGVCGVTGDPWERVVETVHLYAKLNASARTDPMREVLAVPARMT